MKLITFKLKANDIQSNVLHGKVFIYLTVGVKHVLHQTQVSWVMILLEIDCKVVKDVAVNTNLGFVAHVTMLSVAIKVPTPIETMMLPFAFVAVAAAVAAASASSSLP
jgi:hypothetical protein